MGWANWAKHSPQKIWANIGPNVWVDLGPTNFSFFFLFLGPGWTQPDSWAGPILARPKVNVNYLQNVNSGSRSACNRNGYRK